MFLAWQRHNNEYVVVIRKYVLLLSTFKHLIYTNMIKTKFHCMVLNNACYDRPIKLFIN